MFWNTRNGAGREIELSWPRGRGILSPCVYQFRPSRLDARAIRRVPYMAARTMDLFH